MGPAGLRQWCVNPGHSGWLDSLRWPLVSPGTDTRPCLPQLWGNVMLSPALEEEREKAEVTACLGPPWWPENEAGGERLVVRSLHRLQFSEGLGQPTSRWSNRDPITSSFSSKSISQLVHLCSHFPSLALLCSSANGDPRTERPVTMNSLVAGRDRVETRWQ